MDRGFEEIAEFLVRDKWRGGGVGQPIFLDETTLFVERHFGDFGFDPLDPFIVDFHWHEIGIGKIAVIVGHLLGAHGGGVSLFWIPAPCLLRDRAAFLQDGGLAFDFVCLSVANSGYSV